MSKPLNASVAAFIPRKYGPDHLVANDQDHLVANDQDHLPVDIKTWDPICLRIAPDVPEWMRMQLAPYKPPEMFHWSHGLIDVPVCEEPMEPRRALAAMGMSHSRIGSRMDIQRREASFGFSANVNANIKVAIMTEFILKLFEKANYAVWHGMEASPRMHDYATASHVIERIQHSQYSPLDLFISIGMNTIRVNIEWICHWGRTKNPLGIAQSEHDVFIFEISYYQSARLADPLRYVPYPDIIKTIEVPQLPTVLPIEDATHLLQDLALAPSYAIDDPKLIVKLQEIVNRHNICHLVRWGGDGIMIAGCDNAYRTLVKHNLPTILTRMVRGVRKILRLYVLLEHYIGIQVEFMREYQELTPLRNLDNIRPVFKVSYFK